jgi:hypothetical protein
MGRSPIPAPHQNEKCYIDLILILILTQQSRAKIT